MSLSSNDRELACNLQTRFEFELGIPAFNEKQITGSRTARSARSLHESGELTYILRMLLHRNDSLGMASSIESRFPFLDRQLLQLAVNLPLDCKLRFSPRVLEREHLFFRDKWIIRKIAERYLPSVLSKRKKRGFPTSAQKRLHIADSYWQDSFIQDLFGLSHARMQFVVSEASHAFKNRLLQLDLWGKLFFQRVAKSELADQLAASTRVLTGRETFPSNSSDAFPGASCRTVPSYSARGHNEKRAA